MEVTHLSPLPQRDITPCCGKAPGDLPRTDRMTNDVALVTCGVKDYASGVRRFTYFLHGGDDDLLYLLEHAFGKAGFSVRPAILQRIGDLGNPFYEVAVSCEIDTDTGDIRLLGLVK